MIVMLETIVLTLFEENSRHEGIPSPSKKKKQSG